MNDIYHQDLIDEAKNPSNFGELKDHDIKTTSYNASCGDVITVWIKLSTDKKKILDVRWRGHGCIISQASMSLMSQKLKGFKVSKLKELSKESVLEELGLEDISVGRVKCLLLGISAVKKILF